MPNPVPFKQNLDNTTKLVETPEFIEFYKQSNSPWANFFPTEIVDSVNIEFIVKKPKDPTFKILHWNDKSKGLEVGYVDTDKIIKEITKEASTGEMIGEVDLFADNGQNLLESMQYEVANDLADYLANNDTNTIAKSAKKVIITDTTPVGYLKSMLSAWNTLFQLRNSNNCKFFITNSLYDTLVYLADNKGLITDNQLAQQLRLNGTNLYIKGVLCQIVMDDYMTFKNTENKNQIMNFVLATPKAMKRYMLQQTSIYVEDIKDGKVPKRYLVGGQVTGESIPYMSNSETESRWMLCGIVNKKYLSEEITTLTTNITADTTKKNKLLDTTIKNTTELNNLNPNLTTPIINYFSDAQGQVDVSNQNQKAGDLYVVITTNDTDKNYQGSTNPIKITLK
ncbi:hypothetical protein [Spiroplasma endosymbiont of Andrena trimmerana]|uniref:hypothetical protein n=1 Tax=Spiroplasma endosymbiont of Andrena trimmerana TaxID=3066316 RepID=UPI0030D42359